MAADGKMKLKMSIPLVGEGATRLAKLDSGASINAPFVATYSDEKLQVEMTIDVVDAAPSCTRYVVERLDGKGLEYVTTEVARGLNLRGMMARAVMLQALAFVDGENLSEEQASVFDAMWDGMKRRKEPVNDVRLQQFADAYTKRYERGKAHEFAESQNVSERQMYRLKKLAVQRGFLAEGDKK